MSTNEETITCLKGIELFQGLGEIELGELITKLHVVTYPAGTTIVKEGKPGDALFFVKAGSVQVKKREPSTGIDLTVATLSPGDCFGEMSLITEKTRSASVVVTEGTAEVMMLGADDFKGLLKEHPTLAQGLSRMLAQRVEEMNGTRGVSFLPLSQINLDPGVIALIPQQLMARHRVIPIACSSGTLTLGMVNPQDLIAIDEVKRFVRGVAIEPVAISSDDLQKMLKPDAADEAAEEGIEGLERADGHAVQESAAASLESAILKDMDLAEPEELNALEIQRRSEDAPIIRLANSIIVQALKKGASDIHLEPMERALRVRYRIDGVLQEGHLLPKKVHLPLASRVKIMSGLDITERRLPQDGRITMRFDHKPVDFRVSSVPTKFGEKIVIRVLDKGSSVFSLDRFVTNAQALGIIREMIKRPYGIIYVTGPTGSGKTTTLYSALAELNKNEVNISTVEDPVEYDLAGVNQIQVNPDIGLDFARVLRALLRQDPDIMLVGETRDKETARIAVEAALTGHLVFTTIHANDAAGTCIRLIEMGVEPFLIASSLIGVIAQRLVRRICPRCKESYAADEVTAAYLGIPEGTPLARGHGCQGCGFTGYAGRLGVFEVLDGDDELRHLVAEGSTSQAIRNEAVSRGMVTLKDYAIGLLKEGSTTVDEVLRTVVIPN
jgi:type IV pilus assembly protein PilB